MPDPGWWSWNWVLIPILAIATGLVGVVIEWFKGKRDE